MIEGHRRTVQGAVITGYKKMKMSRYQRFFVKKSELRTRGKYTQTSAGNSYYHSV